MSLKKGLSIFLLLSIAVSGSLLYFTVDRASLAVFADADPRYIALALLLVVCMWICDALKIRQLTMAAGESMTFSLAIKLTWINYFGAALTPMQSGGGPFQMYLMYKNGIGVGKTVAITLVRTFLSIFVLGLSLPCTLLADHDMPDMGWGMKGFLAYASVVIVLVLVCFTASVVRPQLVKRVVGGLIMRLGKIGLLKKKRVFPFIRRAILEIDAYRENVCAFMTTGRRPFVISIFLAIAQMACYLSVMPCMIWAVIGADGGLSYTHCVLVQALFIFMLYFIPTPGGSGAAEGGAALIASLFVPMNMAGLIGVGWRILTEYTGIICGVLVALKAIGWSIANQLASTKNDAEVEKTAGEVSDAGGKNAPSR